jgi:hypothetical protein
VRDDSRHPLERYAECDGRWANLRERARLAKRGECDPIALTHSYNFAYFIGAGWLYDHIGSASLRVERIAKVSGADELYELLRQS